MLTKKIKIKKVRNVLESPFNVQQWTAKSEDELKPLKYQLKELLPAAKLEQVALKKHHWKKQGSKDVTYNVLTKERQQSIYRKFLAPGFQSVVRGLEKGDLCCIILAGNISPLLQKVLLSYSQINCVPVAIVSDLKNITKSALGFATMVLGFKNVVVDPENKFFPIYTLVAQNQISFVKTSSRVEEDVSMEQTVCASESLKPLIKSEDLYLLRNHTGERAFIPVLKSDENDQMIFKRKTDNFDDFISLKKEISGSVRESINKKNEGFDLEDTSDDSDSDIDNVFFVDRKQDASLLVAKNVDNNVISTSNVAHSNKPKFKNKTKKGISYNMSNMDQVGIKSSNSSILKNMKHVTKKNKISKQFQNLETNNKNKKLLAKQKNQHKMHPLHSSHINFNPLKIKTIAQNPKKIKRKKKK